MDLVSETPAIIEFGHFRIVLRRRELLANGLHTAKFGQQPVAGVLYGTAPVFPNLRLDQLPEMRFQPFVRPLLIRPHKPRIPCHIGG
jgi:hypothetical protein